MDEAFYTDMLDAMSDGVMVFDHDKRITFCNQAFLDITGFTRGDLDHALSAILEGAGTDPKVIAAINASLSKGAEFDGEILSFRKSGEPFFNHLVIKPAIKRSGGENHFIGIVRDVTSKITNYSGFERDYEFIFENVLAGIIIHDPDSRVRFINRKAREMLGLTGNAAIDRTAEDRGWQFLRPDGSPMPLEELPFNRAIDENTTVRGVLLGRKHPFDDSIGWALCDAFLARNDAGEVTAVLVSFSDVSRLIESEKSANAYRERFELAARASQDVIFEWNIETDAFSANEAFKNIYGYDPPAIMTPENLDALIATENGQHVVRDVALEAIESGTDRFSVDYMINRPDGSTGHVAIRAFIVRNSQGEATRVIGTATDIGRLTAALAALEESEARFRIIADTVSDVLWDNNLDSGRLWMTPDWATKLGVPKPSGPPTEAHWRDLISPADIGAALQSYNEALNSKATNWETEYRIISADGRTINVAVKARILRHPDGRAYRVLGSVRDVTALKRQQEGYTRARALEAVGQLTGGVAHDFNNLLMIILGNAEVLETTVLDEDQAESVAMIHQASSSAADLTRRLLSFSRQSQLRAGCVELTSLMTNTVALLRIGIPETIAIRCDLKPSIWQAKADGNALEQAVINLAVNARDAMPDGGEITISAENQTISSDVQSALLDLEAGDYVIISVTDTGHGMPPEVLGRAFEPFFTTKDVGEGTGLGLSTVFGFAKQSGGHATIESEPAHGTTVRIYLPRFAEGEDQEGHVQTTERAVRRTGQRILIVEDEPMVRAHVEKLLSKLGYVVTAAANAQEALSLLHDGEAFDLLFTDVIMPGGMSGPQLGKAALQLAPNIKLLYTSGYPATASENLGLEDLSNVNFLAKPYRSTQLEEKLATILNDWDPWPLI